MFNLYNVSSTVILMGTLIYIAKQTNIQKKDLEMRINYQKREKAIEMAKVFSELIDKTILVSEVLKNLEAINKKNIAKKWMKTGEISLKKKMFVEIYL